MLCRRCIFGIGGGIELSVWTGPEGLMDGSGAELFGSINGFMASFWARNGGASKATTTAISATAAMPRGTQRDQARHA